MTDTSPVPPPQKPLTSDLSWRAARVVFALVLREMSTSYGRNPGGDIWAILQPVAMIAILTIAFSFLLRTPPLGTSFILFYAPGYLMLRLFLDVANSVGTAVQFNLAMMAYPRVTFVDVLFARAILSVLTAIMVSSVVITGIFMITDVRVILNFEPIVQGYLMTIFLAIGIGTLNSYLTFSFPVWRTIWSIITRPLFLVSGVFFMYEDLPIEVQNILWWNPLIHTISWFREGFYSTYQADFVNLTYLLCCASVPMFFGYLLLYRYCKDAIYK